MESESTTTLFFCNNAFHMRTLSSPKVLIISLIEELPPNKATLSGMVAALKDPASPVYWPVVNTARKISSS